MPQILPRQGLFMDKERGSKEYFSLDAARQCLREVWLAFWLSKQTYENSDIRKRKIRECLDKLSPTDRELILDEKEGKNSILAEIREETKILARTGTDPKRIH